MTPSDCYPIGLLVPEPDTYALFFGIATLGFVALRRCRR